MYELRKDPLLSRWVIIARERIKRPSDYSFAVEVEEKDDEENCLLCRGKENKTPKEIMAYRETPSVSNTPNWLTRVFPHEFPVLRIEGELNRQGIGMYDKMNGIGAHEIIVESPDHFKMPEEMDLIQMGRVIMTYRERIADLEKDARLRYVLIFKDQGVGGNRSTGLLSLHPHSQLIATPVIPKKVKEELEGAKIYYDYKERCIFCDIMMEEVRMGVRIVEERGFFIAFCPFAPMSPFEVWILPKRHSCSFTDIRKEEVTDLSAILRSVLLRIGETLNKPPYSYVLHTAPNRIPRRDHWQTLRDDFHWHIEIMPRITTMSGSEWGAGFYIIPTPPEEAARYLKERRME